MVNCTQIVGIFVWGRFGMALAMGWLMGVVSHPFAMRLRTRRAPRRPSRKRRRASSAASAGSSRKSSVRTDLAACGERNLAEGNFPQGLKPCSFWASYGTAEQLAEKVRFSIRNPKNIPQGLKPRIDSIGVMPGMNPRPTARMSFSVSCEAVPFQNSTSTTGC